MDPAALSRPVVALAFALAAVSCLTAPCLADSFPGAPGTDVWAHPPDDPDYGGQWQLFSTLPPGYQGQIAPDEAQQGAGASVDKAWQLHTGTPDTVIAVLDSGIEYDAADLTQQIALNPGELPPPPKRMDHKGPQGGHLAPNDYAGDPRVHATGPGGVVTAGDLIAAFSDGIDNDGNGYVDDIAGWDFHEGRNNPEDRVRFGHGTGEAGDSTAAIDNGVGGAGVCGHCSYLPVRVGDSFVADANAFARAVIFAVDHGARIIQEALGAPNNDPFVKYAVNYAYDHDVVIIGSAADEDSYHHNFPGTVDPIVYTNALRADTDDVDQATTFVAFNACSNYGARVDVATPGLHCSSEATGVLSGIAGLATSYARSLGKPLTAGELIQLLKTTATDINKGPNTDDPTRWSTYAGWDNMTGYGRVDAFKILDRIRTGDVPPEARITQPEWFESFANQDDGALAVQIEARTPRSGAAKIRLEVARGVETSGTSWTVVQESPVLSAGVDGVFAKVPFALLTSLPPNTRDQPQDAHSFTLRLVVDDLAGHVAESRRTFFWWHDDQLLPGFPRRLAGSGESAGLFADLRGDGQTAYVTADGAGLVHAFTASGDELAGFPARTARSRYGDPARPGQDCMASIFAPVAAGDLTHTGKMEVVAVSMEGHVSVIEPNGRMRPGFPVQLPAPDMRQASPDQIIAPGAWAAPVLADLQNEGHLDIVVMGFDGRIHAYRPDGSILPGFPYEVRIDGRLAKLNSSPAVADVDGKGYPDLIFGSNHTGADAGYLFAVSGLGNRARRPLRQGFPVRIPLLRDVVLPTIGTGVPTAPVIADIDGSGKRSIIVHGFFGKVWAVSLDGQLLRSMSLDASAHQPSDEQFMLPAFGHPAVGDVKGDGTLSPVTAGAGRRILTALALGGKRIPFQHLVGAWDGATGRMLDGFPQVNDDMALAGSPLVVDLTGDGKGDVVAASGGYLVHAWSSAGEVAGFPHFTGGWVFGAAAAGPLAGNGLLALAATTREGYVFAWQTQAKANAWQQSHGWLTFKGNPQRTGTR